MALLVEDDQFTHIVAIDFGTGASGYGIVSKTQESQIPIIQVFNPCEDCDNFKTESSILFDNQGNFLAFGQNAVQQYAEIVDEGKSALLFQFYKLHLLHMHTQATSIDGREMPLLTIISETLKYISNQATSQLLEQFGNFIGWIKSLSENSLINYGSSTLK